MLQRLLVLLIAFGLAACSGLPLNAVAPRVSVAEVGIKSLGLFEQRFNVGLRVSNPNDFDLTIEALDFELEVNGRPFAKGLLRATTLIPAISSMVLRVDAIMPSKNLIQQIKTLPPETLRDGVPYRIKGRIKTDKSSTWLPFDYAGVVGGDEQKSRGRAV
ncbi:MAG: LEA type 2 family protein [Thiobacillus sp.]|nr:LEA type 2 family protein [Thiobacillus sp.]